MHHKMNMVKEFTTGWQLFTCPRCDRVELFHPTEGLSKTLDFGDYSASHSGGNLDAEVTITSEVALPDWLEDAVNKIGGDE